MKNVLLFGGAAVAGYVLGRYAGKTLSANLPDQFSINIPYGPKFSFKKKATK